MRIQTQQDMYIELIPDTRSLKIVTAANFKNTVQTLWSLEASYRIDAKTLSFYISIHTIKIH